MKKLFYLICFILLFQCYAFAKTYYGARMMRDDDKDGKADKTLGFLKDNKADFDALLAQKLAEGWIICETFTEEVPGTEELAPAAGNETLNGVGCGPIDCDPTDPNKWRRVKVYEDLDGDGHATRTVTVCIGADPPPGHSEGPLPIGDCNPNDPSRWRLACVSIPVPGKPKQWTNSTMCVGILPPPGTWFCGDPPPPTPEIIFTVYPNPVSDRLNITPNANWNERAEVKLVDQYARVVRTLVVPNAVKGQTFTINTTGLKPGLYQLTIRRGELVESRTIAVKL